MVGLIILPCNYQTCNAATTGTEIEGIFPMDQIVLKIKSRRHGVLLALVSAMALGLVACGEQTNSKVSQDASDQKSTSEVSKQATSYLNMPIEVVTKMAEAGDSEAQFQLGIRFRNGEQGVATDASRALAWFKKAAEAGHARAYVFLGWTYQQGIGVPVDILKAIQWFEKAAARNEDTASWELGMIYMGGVVVPKDVTQAIAWFEKEAAIKGSWFQRSALQALGEIYQFGEGVPKDEFRAVEWYTKAADLADAEAHLRLWNLYDRGAKDVRDASKARSSLEKAANLENEKAQYFLGMMYLVGSVVPKDDSKAATLLEKSAAAGFAPAQMEFASMLASGQGVTKDMVLSYAWANLAAAVGDKQASKYRDRLERHLPTLAKAEGQRLSSNWKKGEVLKRENAPSTANDGAKKTSGELTKQGTGTAFFVSKSGLAVTNNHVVNTGCTEVRMAGREGIVKVNTTDPVNDLALLQVPGAVDAAAAINSDPAKLRQGDDIVVFGFPLNAVLSSGGNLTPGIVSAVTGLGNNSNQIQITAPIQPGSSGSPVLNRKGEVVAVVSMKLSDSKMAKATGSVGQNVNFAVSGQTLKSFLDAHKVEYSTGGVMSFSKSTADLADEAKKWTTVVECWK